MTTALPASFPLSPPAPLPAAWPVSGTAPGRHGGPAQRAAARRRAWQRRHPRVSRLLAWLLAAVLGSAVVGVRAQGVTGAVPGAALPAGVLASGTLPTGGRIVIGTGQLQQSNNLLLIQQQSGKLGLDWQSFNIGSGATVEFRQPGADSVALNRVLGHSGSEIYGQLKANGQVFLTNPNGVLFAPGAKVDVGGLVASTLDLSQQDFADGRYVFKAGAQGAGSVVNQGSLRANAGGYLALFGTDVANQGDLSVDAGSVLLASGRAATVSISGSGLISAVLSADIAPGLVPGRVTHSGRISADGGVVTLTAKSAQDIAASLVNNSGIIRANTLVERAGEVWITGDQVAHSGHMSAAAPAGGDAGRILLIGDLKHGQAQVSGTLDASAAAGRGGFIETSAARVKVADGARITTAAPGGATGTWLIDPVDFTIAASGGDITGAALSALLATNNVPIASSGGASGTAGDIFVNDTVTWAANRLTLTAFNHIWISSPLTGSGSASLTLEYGQGALATGNSSFYRVNSVVTLPAGSSFSTKQGSNGTPVNYSVIHTLADLQNIGSTTTTLGGNWALGANIDASSTGTGVGFDPIGDQTSGSTALAFTGRFDGLGHSIASLGINRPTSAYVGLFANTSNATISNVALLGGSVTGGAQTGGLVGYAIGATHLTGVSSGANVVGTTHAGGLVGNFTGSGSLFNADATGTVSGSGNVGGLIGQATGTGNVTGGSAAGAVTGTSTSGNVGGLIGNATISGGLNFVSATGNVAGGNLTGGLVGNYTSNGNVGNALATGTVSGSSTVGGLIGYAAGTGSLTDATAAGAVTATTSNGYSGGLVGRFAMTGGLQRGEAAGNVSGGSNAGGLVGWFNTAAALTDSLARGTTVSGTTWAGGLVGYSESLAISGSVATANVTATGSAGGLVGRSAGSVTGVAGVNTATGNVTGTDFVGGLVGQANGSGNFGDVRATGNVLGTGASNIDYVGGLVGFFNSGGNVANASAVGSVSGVTTVGGLIGYAVGAGALTDSTATGAVAASSPSYYVGGLVGRYAMNGALSNGRAEGSVSGGAYAGGLVGYFNSAAALTGSTSLASTVAGGQYAGGLVGYSEGASISGSRAVANVTATGSAGGLVGRSAGSLTGVNGTTTASGSVTGGSGGYIGGVVGRADGTGALTYLSATGPVTGVANSGYVGGLAGAVYSGSVVRGRASGTVSGGFLTGGLIGDLERNGASIEDGLASGNVTGGTNVGGLVGRAVSGGSPGGALTNGRATGNVVATTNDGSVGGLAGVFNMTGGMTTARADGTVTGGSQAGGLVGYFASASALTGGTATGATVTGGTTNAGGLIGDSYATAVTNSTALAAVTGGTYAGGLIGTSRGNVTGTAGAVTARGNVSGNSYVGGLVGYSTGAGAGIDSLTDVSATGNVAGGSNSTYVGGLIGYAANSNVLRGSASGAVSGGNQTGGLVGFFTGTGYNVSFSSASGAVTGSTYAGGLIGRFYFGGDLLSSTASGTVVGTSDVGGLAGEFYASGSISNSTASGRVTGGTYVGGLVGVWEFSGNLTDSRATGEVVAESSAGGLVGFGNSNDSVTNSTAAGRVTGSVYVGGLVGYLAQTNVSLGIATGPVAGVGEGTVYAGGLVGYFSNGETGGQISNSRAAGTVYGDASTVYAGGLVGYANAGSIVSTSTTNTPSATGNVTATDSANAGTTGHYAGGLVGFFNGNGISGASTVSPISATGSVSGRYFAGGLAGQYSGSASLLNSAASGRVTGTQYVGGLVGEYSGDSVLTNGVASGNVTGTQQVGGLVGYLQYAGISNGVASGRVTATGSGSYAGGLVGYALPYYANSAITGSRASGDVQAVSAAGGLVGYFENYYISSGLNSGIANSSASGNVGADQYAGGLVGRYNGSYFGSNAGDQGIRNAQASGNVLSAQYGGGLVGHYQGYGGIQDSGASGTVSGTSGSSAHYLGGLAGYFTNYNSTSGAGTLTRSYASGAVTLPTTATLTSSTDVYVGGLVGYVDGASATALTVTDAYATGAVNAANTLGRLRVGGLAGYTDTSLARTYATGAVTAAGGSSQAVGGLVAQRVSTSATATSSYWATDSTGQTSSVIGTAKTAAELKDTATFTGWDVAAMGGSTGTWRIYPGQTAPLVRSLLTPLTATLGDLTRAYDGTTSLAGAAIAGASNPERIFVGGALPDAGSYGISAGNVYSVQNGYDLSLTGSGTLTIGRRQLTLAGLAASKVYDSTLAATLNAGAQPGNLVAGEDLLFQPGSGFALQFVDKNAGTGKVVNLAGSYTYADGVRGKAANYILPTATSTTADITRATLTAGSFNATDRAYDGTTNVAVAATSTTLAGVLGTDSVSVDLSGVTTGNMADKNVGSGKLVAVSGASLAGADAGNYLLAGIGNVRVNITPKTATLNGIAAVNRAYNTGTSVQLNVAGAALAGIVINDQVEARTGTLAGTVANKNVGNAKPVTLTGLGLRGQDAGNYTPQPGSVSVNITPYLMALDLQRTSQTDRAYDGTTNAAYTFSQTWYGGDNIVPGAISVAYDNKNVAYNGSNQVIGKTITATGLSISGTDAGNYTVTNAGASDTITGTLTPKALVVGGITAVNRVYDGTRDVTVNVISPSIGSGGVVPGDDVQVAVPNSGTVIGQTVDKNFGQGKPVTVPGLALTGGDARNYTVNASGSGVTVDISRKNLTAVYTGVDKVYDGNGYAAVNVTSSDIASGDLIGFFADQTYCNLCGYAYFTTGSSSPGSYVISKNVGTGKPVVVVTNGIYNRNSTNNDAQNYLLVNPTGNTTASITRKPVTLAFTGVSKVYDGTTAANVALSFGGSAGLIFGDTLTSTQTATYTGPNGKNVGTNKPVSVADIVLGGADAGNYTVGNTTAQVTNGSITPKNVTVTGITATPRAYDSSINVAVSAANVTSTGFVGGDAVAVLANNISSGTVADPNTGTNKPVTVTGLGLTGADAGNYSINPTTSGITVNITPKVLMPAFAAYSRVYNGLTGAALVFDEAEVFAADRSYLSFTQQAAFTGAGAKNVGTAKPIGVTGISLVNNLYGNYALASTTATATGNITPKPVEVNYTGVARVYNGVADTSASVQAESLGVLNGDAVGYSQTARYTGDGAAGTAKPISVTGIALTGTDAFNYQLQNPTDSTSADITRRALGVTGISANNRVYDGTLVVALNTAGASVDTSAVIAGDTVTVTLPGNASGTLTDRHAGTGKSVDIAGLGLGGSSAANYQLMGASGLTVNITPANLSASYTGVNKVYDGFATAAVTAAPVGLFAIDNGTILVSAVGTFTGSGARNAGDGKPVAVSGGFLFGAFSDDYVLTNPTGSTTASITRRPLTAGYTGGLSRVYDGGLLAPVTGRLFNVVAGDAVTLTQTSTFADGRNVGNNKPIAITGLALGGPDVGNYSLATSSVPGVTGSVTPKPITVSGLSSVLATDRVYDSTRVVTVTVPSGVTLVTQSTDIVGNDQVVINVPTSGVTTGTVATKNVGTGKPVSVDGLSLGGADGGNYSIAGTAGITVNITPRLLTASYVGINRVYDGTTGATVSGTSDDDYSTDSVFIAGSGIFTGAGGRNVGTGKAITVSSATLQGTDAGNYTLANPNGTATADITRRPVTATYNGGSRVYDGTTAAPVTGSTQAGSGVGFIGGDAVGLTQSAVFTGAGGKNVGTGKGISVTAIALSGSDAGNYSLVNTSSSTFGSITPKALAINGLTGVAAIDRVYDGLLGVVVQVSTTGTLTPSASDLVPGDVVTVNAPPSGTTTGTMASKTAGDNKPVTVTGLTLGGADGANYSITATSGITVNIARRALTASYAGVQRVYDGGTAVAVTGTSGGIVAGDAVGISGSGIYTGPGAKNVGSGKAISVLTASLASTSGANDAVNYTLANPTGTASGSITVKAVTALYSGGTRVYDGGVNAPVSGSASGFVGGDDVALTASAVFTGSNARNVGTNKAVAVTGIGLTGGDAINYSLTGSTADTFASITPKALRINGLTGLTATDRVYDATRNVVVTVTSSGAIGVNPDDLVPGDVVSIDPLSTGLTAGTVDTKNVGNNKPVTVPGLQLGGADGGNYSVAATTGLTVNITPKALTASYTGITRVYDGTTAASLTGTSADIFGTDTVGITGSGVFSGSGGRNAGDGKAIDVLLASLGGADAGNYRLVNPTGPATGSITRKALAFSYTGGTRVYDGTTAAPVLGSLSGFITGDSVALTESAVFSGADGKNAGSGKAISISGITLAGSDAINYSLAGSTSLTTGVVTRRPLRIEGLGGVTAVDRAYDGGTLVALRVNSSGPVGSGQGDVIDGDDVTVSLPAGGVNAGRIADKNVGNARPVVVLGITLTGADAVNYEAGAATGVSVNITPKALTASYTALTKVYDGTARATLSARSDGVVDGDSVTLAGTGFYAGAGAKNVGIGKAISVTGGTLAGADAANYSLANPSVTVFGDITPRLLTALYAGLDKVYDGSISAAVRGSSTDVLPGDDIGYGQTAVFTGDGARNVGSGKQVLVSDITLRGADAGNYTLTGSTAATTASISRRPLSLTGLVGFTAISRVYDGLLTVQVTGSGSFSAGLGNLVEGDNVGLDLPAGGTAGITTGTLLTKNAGIGKNVVLSGFTLNGSDSGNYQITGTAGLTVTIAPRPLVLLGVTALDRVYDGTRTVAIDTTGGSLEGAVAGDDLQLRSSGVTGRMADKHAGQGKAVTVDGLSLDGTDAANYAVAGGLGSNLSVNITRRLLNVTATAAGKVYDGTTAAALAGVTLADDRLAADSAGLSLQAGSASYDSKDAGSARVVTIGGLTLGGADAGDYVLAGSTLTTSAAIRPAPLRLTASDIDKLYGNAYSFSGTEFSASGLVGSERAGALVLGSEGAAALAPVTRAGYRIDIAGAGAAADRASGFDPANYAISYSAGLLTVRPRPLTVAGGIVVRFADEPNPPSFSATFTDGSLVGSDSLQLAPIAAPAGSEGAAGGSAFELRPVGALFLVGNPDNYALNYASGLLLVLPKPPRIGDGEASTGSGNGNGNGLGILDLPAALIEDARNTLDRVAGEVAQPGTRVGVNSANGANGANGTNSTNGASGASGTGWSLPLNGVAPTAADISVALAGDSRRITLPALQKLPLISFDPALRPLAATPAAPASGTDQAPARTSSTAPTAAPAR